jgi:hypothetical protein
VVGFEATVVETKLFDQRLGFGDTEGQHYFLMERSDDVPSGSGAFPEMPMVYIERDDQCWGGYGGITAVSLDRAALELRLSPGMRRQMGGHDVIRITFHVDDATFEMIRAVLASILDGYSWTLNEGPGK